MKKEGKNWVIADVHGQYEALLKILSNPLIKEEDKVTFLGDMLDRGPYSLKVLDWAMKNISEDGKYQMLIGNHEMNIVYDYEAVKRRMSYMIGVGTKHIEEDMTFRDLSVYELTCKYGFEEYMDMSGKSTIGDIIDYIKWMKTLPLYKMIVTSNNKKFILAHAWFKGHIDVNGDILPDISTNEILCHRDIDESFNLAEDYQPMEDEILIHGHTPVITISGFQNNKAVPLFRENSINIDGGCYFEGRGRLMALRLEDNYVIYGE